MNCVQSRIAVVFGVLVVVVGLSGGDVLGQEGGFRDPLGGALESAREGAEGSRRGGVGEGVSGVDGASGGVSGAGSSNRDGVGVAVGSEAMRVRQLMEGLMVEPGGGVGEAEVKARLEALVEEAGVMARRLDAGPLRGAALGVRIQALYGLVTRWPGDVLGEVRLAEMRRAARQMVAMGGSDSASVGDYWLMMAELVEINRQEGLGGAERRRLARREMNRYLERYRSGPSVGAVRDAVFALNGRIERDRAAELRRRVEVGREIEGRVGAGSPRPEAGEADGDDGPVGVGADIEAVGLDLRDGKVVEPAGEADGGNDAELVVDEVGEEGAAESSVDDQ